MKAKSIKGKSVEEIRSALDQSTMDGFRPTLAIVFMSIKQDKDTICQILHWKGIDIIGATSSGEFIDGHQDEGSIVILLLDLSPDSYTILFENIGDRNLSAVSGQIAQAALKRFKKPAFIILSTCRSPADHLWHTIIFPHFLSRSWKARGVSSRKSPCHAN